jgi:adenine-specific DNA-methyltransferase
MISKTLEKNISTNIGLNNSTQEISLESRRYIGSKAKLADWIIDKIDNYTNNVNSFFDVFAGTAIVTKSASKLFKNIIINDILYSNNIIYKAFFGDGDWSKKKLEKLIGHYNSIQSDEMEENYFSNNFGNKFFDIESSKKIGYIRNDIEKLKPNLTDKEYSILLATLIYNIDKIANTVGHYEAYIKKPIAKKQLHLKLIKPYDFPKTKIYRENANDLARKIESDVAYIDPPYNSRQYSRFYHLYETLVKWDEPELFGVALKPKVENMSAYCTVKARDAFHDLVNNLNVKYCVVSYNNTYNSKSSSSENKIKLEEIESILNDLGKTKVFDRSHQFFNTGKTEFADHKEFLFITKING